MRGAKPAVRAAPAGWSRKGAPSRPADSRSAKRTNAHSAARSIVVGFLVQSLFAQTTNNLAPGAPGRAAPWEGSGKVRKNYRRKEMG